MNLSSNNKENLDDYELFQYSQNLDQEKCLLGLTSNPTLHIVDKNLVDNQLKETIDIEKDTFDNLKQYFSLEIRNFKSRYIDISKYLNDYDTNFYSTTDLMNLENLPNYFDSINTENIVNSLQKLGKVFLSTRNEIITEKFSELNNVTIVDNPFSFSASFKDLNLAIIDESLFQKRKIKKSKRKTKKISEESILVPNTYIVHNFHGIGLYEGTVVKKIKGVEKDYLEIKFAGTDKLFVPSEQINELEVYIGGENPKLSHLGGAEWEKAKEKAKQNAKIIADRVLNLYKLRNIRNDSLIISEDTPWQNEIENSFEYIETPDQLTAINDVKKDLEKNVPMDRLIFGDVGYGKTEVALRAAIKVAFSGSQVALLAPTTILVQQHIDTCLLYTSPSPRD